MQFLYLTIMAFSIIKIESFNHFHRSKFKQLAIQSKSIFISSRQSIFSSKPWKKFKAKPCIFLNKASRMDINKLSLPIHGYPRVNNNIRKGLDIFILQFPKSIIFMMSVASKPQPRTRCYKIPPIFCLFLNYCERLIYVFFNENIIVEFVVERVKVSFVDVIDPGIFIRWLWVYCHWKLLICWC